MNRTVLFLCFFVLTCANGAKILGIFQMGAPSHYILGSSLMRALVEQGHDVTFISAFEDKNPPKGGNYTDIVLDGIMEITHARIESKDVFDLFEKTNTLLLQFFLTSMGQKVSSFTLEHKKVQELLHSDEKFDLVIIEQFMNDAFRAFALKYNAPLIIVSTLGANPWVNRLVANPAPVSYIPALMSSFLPKMNFWQRLYNAYNQMVADAFYNWYFLPQQRNLVRKHFPDVDLEKLDTNVDLVLLNAHPSLNQPVPLVPNMINIGGFHIKPPKKLPKDLQDYLDSAKDGFIYFSMGSNLKSANLPEEKRNALINNFKKLKLKVLWKWEDDSLPNQPDNVKLIKWAPQQDILAHPNIKLFITHGGLLSTTETIYHGVPILAIPVFADQNANAANAENQGYGLALRIGQLTEEALGEKLNEVLNNPKYSIVAKTKSKIFHDREKTPMESALYWIEYVLRHGGAPHLKVEGINLPWYKYYLVDVMLFVALVSLVVLKALCVAFKGVRYLVRCKGCKKDNKKDNKKLKKN